MPLSKYSRRFRHKEDAGRDQLIRVKWAKFRNNLTITNNDGISFTPGTILDVCRSTLIANRTRMNEALLVYVLLLSELGCNTLGIKPVETVNLDGFTTQGSSDIVRRAMGLRPCVWRVMAHFVIWNSFTSC